MSLMVARTVRAADDIISSILSGVPTDQQLCLHLLRVGEALNKPLPRPP